MDQFIKNIDGESLAEILGLSKTQAEELQTAFSAYVDKHSEKFTQIINEASHEAAQLRESGIELSDIEAKDKAKEYSKKTLEYVAEYFYPKGALPKMYLMVREFTQDPVIAGMLAVELSTRVHLSMQDATERMKDKRNARKKMDAMLGGMLGDLDD